MAPAHFGELIFEISEDAFTSPVGKELQHKQSTLVLAPDWDVAYASVSSISHQRSALSIQYDVACGWEGFLPPRRTSQPSG